MSSKTDPGKLSLFWVLQISGWLLYGVIYYLIYYSYKDLGIANTIGFAVTYMVAFVVTIFMRKIYQKLDYQHRSILNVSAIVILTSIIFAVIWVYLDRLVSYPIYGIEKFQQALDKITMRSNISQIYWNSFILFTWSTLYFLINFWRQWNEQLARTEKAELLAHSAQLQMLRYQLNPHFLFNSLNSIRALILEDQNKARDMVTELAELLRYSLVSKNNGDVPFSDEITAIKHYFAIEEKRYEENLQVNFEIDPLAEEYPIPSFLVHPLVENAVKYGMKTSSMPLKIKIQASVRDNELTITVRNSGTWLAGDAEGRSRPEGTGTGLKNVKERLENRFPGKYDLTISEEDGCVVIKISISRDVEGNHA
ncbi:MAG: histidine kinase [Candidatus Marinimicrobia bacterium]|nr:histidine kinase [Candidatus Neomarinimicrobiota bacterium]MCF7922520.1 histidine kinase [Candidatus Neomarinimicrobiota bacterium]